MLILMGTVFLASLLGSLHCVGMCGPFALLASVDSERRNAAIVPTAMYSLGRLVTYSVVGLIFGAVGMALNLGTSFASLQQTATYVAGGLMIVVGLIALARHLGFSIWLPKVFSPVQRQLQKAFGCARRMQPIPRAFTIGALSSLMPCGWLYTFAITAAGTGSPVWGMALMVSFWLGTVPIMTALVFGANKIGGSVQKKVPVLMACLVLLLGVFTIGYRAPVALGAESQVIQGVDALVEQVHAIKHDDLPCCQE